MELKVGKEAADQPLKQPKEPNNKQKNQESMHYHSNLNYFDSRKQHFSKLTCSWSPWRHPKSNSRSERTPPPS